MPIKVKFVHSKTLIEVEVIRPEWRSYLSY